MAYNENVFSTQNYTEHNTIHKHSIVKEYTVTIIMSFSSITNKNNTSCSKATIVKLHAYTLVISLIIYKPCWQPLT